MIFLGFILTSTAIIFVGMGIVTINIAAEHTFDHGHLHLLNLLLFLLVFLRDILLPLVRNRLD